MNLSRVEAMDSADASHHCSGTDPMQTLLVTGGAGFIGSCFVRRQIKRSVFRIINLDLLTYASRGDSIPVTNRDSYVFVRGDIGDGKLVSRLLHQYKPIGIVNFAAESHVDRSIDRPSVFLKTNVVGTFQLLESSLAYFRSLDSSARSQFRFLQVSTDEVFGSLAEGVERFHEGTPYAPNSPYAASKASSDMFVRSYHKTYGLPTLTTNCSNNYGPYQFPEKFIPLMILNLLERRPLPLYGDGLNIRDWLYVDDHCEALDRVLQDGRIGDTYNIGGSCARTNLNVAQLVCDLFDRISGRSGDSSRTLIDFVDDRPGHDRHYEVDFSKIKNELDWQPRWDFEDGLQHTIQWYIANHDWVRKIQSGDYQRQRLGLRS